MGRKGLRTARVVDKRPGAQKRYHTALLAKERMLVASIGTSGAQLQLQRDLARSVLFGRSISVILLNVRLQLPAVDD